MSTSGRDVANRASQDVASVKALGDMMQSIASDPSPWLERADVLLALSSQGALAAFVSEEKGIRKMSLNHQKRVAEEALGSYRLFDGLRKSAGAAISREKARQLRGNTQTKKGMHARIQELEREKTELLQDLFIVQRAYDLRCNQARSYAQAAGPAVRERCSKEQKEIDASFALRSRKPDGGNVTPFGGKK